jgi:hypothetical protein
MKNKFKRCVKNRADSEGDLMVSGAIAVDFLVALVVIILLRATRAAPNTIVHDPRSNQLHPSILPGEAMVTQALEHPAGHLLLLPLLLMLRNRNAILMM